MKINLEIELAEKDLDSLNEMVELFNRDKNNMVGSIIKLMGHKHRLGHKFFTLDELGIIRPYEAEIVPEPKPKARRTRAKAKPEK